MLAAVGACACCSVMLAAVTCMQNAWLPRTAWPPATPAALDASMNMKAAPMRQSICFSAVARFHRYGRMAQSFGEAGGGGRAATGGCASAVLLSYRYVLFMES